NLFWKVLPGETAASAGASPAAAAPVVLLAAAAVLVAVLAAPLKAFTDAAAADLAAPSGYVERVLGPGHDARASVRPLPGQEGDPRR
ncbi:MAG: hypothetical protein N2544_15330, partial [Burkholderiales bacterium]|nr:hypothetical protein [Burkholderiales bacterium]